MKKFLPAVLLLCTLVLTAVFCGCGQTDTPDDNQVNNAETTKPENPYVDYCLADAEAILIDVGRGTTKYSLYEIEVAADEAFTNLVSSELNDTGYATVVHLLPNTQYYVRVRGCNGTNYSAYSAVYPIQTSPMAAESVSVEEEQLDLFIGDTVNLCAEVLPENVTDNSIVWSSLDESVATVSQDGTVTAVGLGNTAVFASAHNGKCDVCAVHVGRDLSVSETETLVIDQSTLNGNAVFGKYAHGITRIVEKNVSFDGFYRLWSFTAHNMNIGNDYYAFGGLYREANADGIPFTYTWTDDSGYDFDGNDCALVTDEHNEQTLGFVGAGAYEKIYLLSMADDYTWDSRNSTWQISYGDVTAVVTITYEDGTTEEQTVNFGNMLNKNESLPCYDAYTLTSILARIDSTLGSAGDAPYAYAVPVDCNPAKQLSSVTLRLTNTDSNRRVTLAVFAVTGQISQAAPDAVDSAGTTVSNLGEYGFTLSWQASDNATGYYVSIFEDEDCTSVCYTNVFGTKVYLEQAVLYNTIVGFENNYYLPGQTYYVKIAAFNANGSSKAVVIPVTTVGTYPKEIRLMQKTVDLVLGADVVLNAYFPTTSYYTYSALTWTVSDDTVLRVSDGKVTGVGTGTATVRAALTQYPNIYAECTVTVGGYEDDWFGYDNGVFLDDDTYFNAGRFLADMTHGAIRITTEQTNGANVLDAIRYYVNSTDNAQYEIYLVDSGNTPIGQKPVVSGTIPTTSNGWVTITLDNPVTISEGKELWIAVYSTSISRADIESENGSYGKINYKWAPYTTVDVSGTVMLRAHMVTSANE